MIDVRAYFDEHGVDYRDKGKNVMREHVAINCHFCGDDKSNHLNVKFDGTHALCFRCGRKITQPFQVIQKIMVREEMSNRDLVALVKEYPWSDEDYVAPAKSKSAIKFDRLWNSFDPIDPSKKNQKQVIRYLEKRHIDITMAQALGIRVGTGDWSYRVIIPVRDADGNVMSFATRHISSTASIPHLHCPSKKSKEELGNLLLGVYEAKSLAGNYVVVVEGSFDWLNLAQHQVRVVGLLKKRITKEQKDLLFENFASTNHLFLALDRDVTELERMDMIEQLSVHFSNVSYLSFNGVKDAGDLLAKDIRALKKGLLRHK